MINYKKEFIQFLLDEKALLFGEFMTKSGRKSPYFINTGQFCNGFNIAKLGAFYAAHINNIFPKAKCLFGPAYKGIPLVVSTAISLREHHDRIVSYSFNRKEIKDHGEKGLMIGQQLSPSDELLLIDDVITAGLSIEESLKLLKAQGNPTVIGVAIAVDRMEKNQQGEDVIKLLQEQYHFQIAPIVTINEILAEVKNLKLLNEKQWGLIEQYRQQFGVRLPDESSHFV